jgi:hypothetical protein
MKCKLDVEKDVENLLVHMVLEFFFKRHKYEKNLSMPLYLRMGESDLSLELSK